MNDSLDKTLSAIGEDYAGKISESSRFYIEVDIGKKAARMGFSAVGKRYQKVLAVVPIKNSEKGMKVRIDGRTFVGYGQLESGVAIPGNVIRKSKLTYKKYVAQDSMILNFT